MSTTTRKQARTPKPQHRPTQGDRKPPGPAEYTGTAPLKFRPKPPPPRLCRHGDPSFVNAEGAETDQCSRCCRWSPDRKPNRTLAVALMAAAMVMTPCR